METYERFHQLVDNIVLGAADRTLLGVIPNEVKTEEVMETYLQLESAWAEFNSLEPIGMVVCNSGTAALHLALESLKLPLGSLVIVPNYCMVACARAVTLAGLKPVFVDCGDDLLLDPAELETYKIASAILPVHTYGRVCDMDGIHEFAARYDMRVVEDLAESHGVKPHPKSDVACWSFYRNKVVAGEEGGAVAFRDPQRAILARQLRTLGFTQAHDFYHVARGHNYRLSNTHASLILKSLEVVESNLKERRQIEAWYDAECPLAFKMPMRAVPWVYDFRVKAMTASHQDAMVKELNRDGIAARHGFKPMTWQPEYRDSTQDRSKAALLASEVVYLPIVPGTITKEMTQIAFDVVKRVL